MKTMFASVVILAALAVGCSASPETREDPGVVESAIGSSGVETIYYSDATFTVEVGAKYTGCLGTSQWGRTTIYKEMTSFTCNPTPRPSGSTNCYIDNTTYPCP